MDTTGIQGYYNIGIQGYRDSRILGYKEYRDSGIRGHRITGIQKYGDTGIQKKSWMKIMIGQQFEKTEILLIDSTYTDLETRGLNQSFRESLYVCGHFLFLRRNMILMLRAELCTR